MFYKIKRTIKNIYADYVFTDKMFITKTFYKTFGFYPNLKNPTTFNEKIQWLKLYDRNPLRELFADKFLVRDFVLKRIGKEFLIPLISQTKEPSLINFSELPQQFVIKANHGCKWNILVRDKNKIDTVAIIRTCNNWLTLNYYDFMREWCYRNIKPRILIEKLLLSKNSEIPSDFKFFCFNGKVRLIQVDFERHEVHKRNLYDQNLNLLEFGINFPTDFSRSNVFPENIGEMIKLSEELAAGFSFLRVDLYNLEGNIFFGELTNFPESGFGVFSYNEGDYMFGKMLELQK